MLWGIVGLAYGNDGTQDGKGMRGYFLCNLLAYLFAADTLFEVAGLCTRLWTTLLAEYRSTCCGRISLRIFEWAVMAVKEYQVLERVFDSPDDDAETDSSFQMTYFLDFHTKKRLSKVKSFSVYFPSNPATIPFFCFSFYSS